MMHIATFGYAYGGAAKYPGCADGPGICQRSSFINQIKGVSLDWRPFFVPPQEALTPLEQVKSVAQNLANQAAKLTKNSTPFLLLGGDHSAAIGTWSGVATALPGPLGLIWIDAHLDSHTLQTSPSGNIHGMPAAILLGMGAPSLVNLMNKSPKIKPEHLCFVGVRSFEPEEEALINQLGIRVFGIQEVLEKGINKVMREAVDRVTRGTVGYGISLDLDSIDPSDAPGTGTPVSPGIPGERLCEALTLIADDPRRLAQEIVEFDPHRDLHHKTERLIAKLISAVLKGTF